MNESHLNNRIDAWLASRPWNLLPYCLPVLLVGILSTLLLYVLFSQSVTTYQHRYQDLTRALLSAGKFEEARVACLRGLSQAKNERDSAQWLFYMAVAINGLGNQPMAEALVRAAAPLDQPGFLEAQLAVAENLLSDTNLTGAAIQSAALNPTNATALTLRLAERHLLKALALDPQSVEVNEALGRFYIKTHQPDKARECLLKIYSNKPETALLLAINADLQNDPASSAQWADRAVVAYEGNLLKTAPRYNQSDRRGLLQALLLKGKNLAPGQSAGQPRFAITNAVPEDSPQIWLGIVHLLLLNGKYGPALATLDQQMLVNSNTVSASAIGDLCASWAQSIAPVDESASASRFQLIQKGLANAPDNLILQLLLVQTMQAPGDIGRQAKATLDELTAKATGEQAASWEFALWTDQRMIGNLAAARLHLQKAAQLAPENPRVKNDLAMDLASGQPADQARALTIINTLVDRYPFDPSFRDTRGQILALLGRNQEAVADLEYAAPRLPDSVETRQVLARVYTALGRVPDQLQPNELETAQGLVRDGNYQAALDTLEKASRAMPNPAFSGAMAEVCAAWVATIPASRGAERLRLIAKGLDQNPDNQTLQMDLVQATQVKDDSSRLAQKIMDRLAMSATGDAAVQWDLLLGRDARLRGNLTLARQHLQNAYALSPKSMEIQIELAMVLSQGNQADLAQGLTLIQPAVEQFPDDPKFLNIRGLIFARLGRNQEAEADLAYAATRLADPRQTRVQLAAVYDALGKTKAAEEQRRLLREEKPW